MRKFLNISELNDLNELIANSPFNDVEMTITFNVPTHELLDKLNESVYYMNNKEGSPEKAEEINLTFGNDNVTYSYQIEKNNG